MFFSYVDNALLAKCPLKSFILSFLAQSCFLPMAGPKAEAYYSLGAAGSRRRAEQRRGDPGRVVELLCCPVPGTGAAAAAWARLLLSATMASGPGAAVVRALLNLCTSSRKSLGSMQYQGFGIQFRKKIGPN